MDYISTRDPQAIPAKFTDILLGGLAPDGGLYLPVEYPQLDPALLNSWRTLLDTEGYAALAAEVLKLYIDDIPTEDIEAITARAYTHPKFSSPEIVPVTELGDDLWVGHLSEGPTAAFKDMAMQLLGELFEYELARRGESLNILGATSGDTGSSAEFAMRGREGIRVFMLTPAGRMTAFQQAQMFGLDDPNIFNIALDGVFDDCQDVVKAVSADAEFKATHRIGAVNSINWARLLAQVVYYIAMWLKVSARINPASPNDARVSFAVPTGNFGDICAGHIARSMGLPIDRLVLATNENDVLDEFFRTGNYRPRPSSETFKTSSPSMDISRASNFERFAFDLVGRDAALIAELFGQRVKEGGFTVASERVAAAAQEFGFTSGSSTHADRLATIADIHARYNYLLDPHTADGVKVARESQAASGSSAASGESVREPVTTPIVCLETALPVKFSETIEEAIGTSPDVPARFADVMDGGRFVTELPNDAAVVKDFITTSIANSESA